MNNGLINCFDMDILYRSGMPMMTNTLTRDRPVVSPTSTVSLITDIQLTMVDGYVDSRRD